VNQDSKTYSVEEVAAQLGVSRGLAYELARRGEIPVLKLGRRMVIPRAAFDEWLAKAPLAGLAAAASA
jgi:excisionase family DNA binding protein